jgi:retron-type reverse transcriptase
MNLYWKFAKAGYMEWDKDKYQYITSDMGVPQGGIISPLLSNLILNELDTHVDKIRTE